ncbi:MAG: ATP-binding protein [Bacteroidales bacterium]|nr:ATP-binding protein [Bacteroidales bacterium]
MEKELAGTSLKIIVTGPESTGKSELAVQLAKELNACYIEEYARDFISSLKRPYTFNDVLKVAEHQRQDWIGMKNKRAVFDTHLIITKVWFEWVFKKYPDWIDEEIVATNNALYLCCNTDLPWVSDSVRENGGENREKLFRIYCKELEKYDLNYGIVSGVGEARVENALKIIQEFEQGKNVFDYN